jgi:hypothetical protein
MMSELDWKYYQDKDFMTRLGSTLTPDAVRAEDYVSVLPRRVMKSLS